MPNQSQIDLIYFNTHRDFKSDSEGIKKVLYFSEHGTCLCPIESLPEEVFRKKLDNAIKFFRTMLKNSGCYKKGTSFFHNAPSEDCKPFVHNFLTYEIRVEWFESLNTAHFQVIFKNPLPCHS